MDDKQKSLEDLNQIRNIMERSTQFLSLSGLSGVFAGIYALIASWFVYNNFSDRVWKDISGYSQTVKEIPSSELISNKIQYALIVGLIVLILSVFTGYFFTSKKAKKSGQNLWSSASKRMLLNLMIPLIVGACFCIMLVKHNVFGLVIPTTLIFYGLALLNASQHTIGTVKYLGYAEIILGIIASYFIGYGLIVWAIGFGVLHIVYGLLMYAKYDKK